MSSNGDTVQDLSEDMQHQQVTQSTILYLLHEATKLTPPESSSSSSPHRDGTRDDSNCTSDFTGSFSITGQPDSGNSAWEVMHLINQQCEWLMRLGCGEQTERDSTGITDTRVLSTSQSCCYPAVSGSHTCSSAAVICTIPPTNDLTHVSDEEEPNGLSELIINNAEENICIVSENGLTENASAAPHVVSVDESRDNVSVALSEDPQICPIDFTSCLVSERDSENLWLPLNLYETSQTHSKPDSSRSADINNNLVESLDKELQEPQDIRESQSLRPACGTCRRTQRKQLRPARSPDSQDPDVQGVTFSMHPELETSTDQCKLVITSNYSKEIRCLRRSRDGRCRSFQTSQRSSGSEEESDSCGASRSKICASCLTRKTPLWRDAEDGTPLCNACGIRYKKYRVRCHHCWNIPKKDGKSISKCLKCGDVLRLNSQQKCSSW